MKVKVIFLVFLTINLFADGQQGSINFIDDYYHLLSKDKDSASIYCDQLTKSSSKDKRAFGYSGKAHLYTIKSKYKIADSLFSKSEQVINMASDKPELISNILYLKALRYVETHEYDIALHILDNAIELCQDNCSFILDNNIYGTMGRIYSMSKNTLKAIEISRNSLERFENQPNFLIDTNLKTQYLKELARISSRTMNLYRKDTIRYKSYIDSSKIYTKKSKNFANQNHINTYDSYIEACFADIEFYKKKFNKAKKYYRTVLYIDKNNEKSKRVAQAEFKIAECDFYLDNLDDAKATFLKHIENDIWSEYQLLDYRAMCFDYLSKIYKKNGDLNKAIEYSETYLKEYKDYLAEKNDSDLNVNNKMHLESRKRELNALKKESKKQEQQKQLFLVATLVLTIIILSLVTFFLIKNKKTKKNIKQLNDRIEWLQKNTSNQEKVVKTTTSSLSDKNALELIEKLKTLEDEEFFKDPDYNLNTVAKKLQTNSTYLSKTVNDYMNISFVEYSNRLKINSIVQRLKIEKSLQNYTIEALAREAGYKSVNSFNYNFKKLLKVTPSQYLHQL